MRMAELSRVSGVAPATIKYYQREGLLPPSDKTAPNQAEYGPAHVARLHLIRALLDVGGLTVTRASAVIASIDSDEPLLYTFAAAQNAVSEHLDPHDVTPAALATVDEVMPGWRVSPGNPGRLAAARVADVFGALGQPDDTGWFRRYAAAALLAAEADLDEVQTRDGRDAKAETVVVGTILGDALFSGLRRAAQEHISSGRHPAPPYPEGYVAPHPTPPGDEAPESSPPASIDRNG